MPGADQIVIATDPTFGNDRYWLQIGASQQDWASVEEAKATALGAWFSQGMNGSIVFDEFSADNAYGWVHYTDFQGNPRTVSVIQYALTNDGEWYEAILSITIGAFEDLDIDEVFDAVSLNDGSVFAIVPQRTMIRAIEDAFAA